MATKDEIAETRSLLNDGFFSPGYSRRFRCLISALDDAELRLASLEGAAEALLKADARIRELEAELQRLYDTGSVF